MNGTLRRIFRTPVRTVQRAHRGAQGYRFGSGLSPQPLLEPDERPRNSIEEYFDSHTVGPGIWKWQHYFEIYHRHFEQFVGRDVHVVEVGIYSGGSLGMWRHYFGPHSQVFGVDIEPKCKGYQAEGVEIWIGDQSDLAFWTEFKRRVPRIDVVIDDGGHEARQQIPTLEALLPHISAGGVYLCEDVGTSGNPFHAYVNGLSRGLNVTGSQTTGLQQMVHSIHHYPLVTVIEKPETPMARLFAPKRGTEWAPFAPGSARRRGA